MTISIRIQKADWPSIQKSPPRLGAENADARHTTTPTSHPPTALARAMLSPTVISQSSISQSSQLTTKLSSGTPNRVPRRRYTAPRSPWLLRLIITCRQTPVLDSPHLLLVKASLPARCRVRQNGVAPTSARCVSFHRRSQAPSSRRRGVRRGRQDTCPFSVQPDASSRHSRTG